MTSFVAVDLGATSARVMLARFDRDGLSLREVHRVANRPVRISGTLHWDAPALWQGVLDGLRAAARAAPDDIRGIGVDSWAVDYGLLDADGRLIANPVHYRDARTDGVADRLARVVPPSEQYARNGVQVLPFTTVYQLAAARDTAIWPAARHVVLIPDLFGYWLTGTLATEITNASTTGLLDPRRRDWDRGLATAFGIDTDLFPDLCEPGHRLGELSPDLAGECRLGPTPVINVASHDTASAVVGIPARGERFAYISCGTWSLVGVELHQPLIGEPARRANFSNELGIDGTVRFLRNVMGLWLLQECVRCWNQDGPTVDLDRLLAEAADRPGGRALIDPDLPQFLPPGDMPHRIAAECRRQSLPEPQTPAEFVRCILDSLAQAYRRTLDTAAELTGHEIEVIHLVGGGSQNRLLCQLTADACERPVVAGPVEAASYGNVLVQARADGVVSGTLAELRSLVSGPTIRTYTPRRD